MIINKKHTWIEKGYDGSYYVNIYINDNQHLHYKCDHIMDAVRLRTNIIEQELNDQNTFIKEDETYFRVRVNLKNKEEIIEVHSEKLNLHMALALFEEAISDKRMW